MRVISLRTKRNGDRGLPKDRSQGVPEPRRECFRSPHGLSGIAFLLPRMKSSSALTRRHRLFEVLSRRADVGSLCISTTRSSNVCKITAQGPAAVK